MRLEGILAQTGLDSEIAHAAAKGSRRPGGQGRYMQGGRAGIDPLAGGHIVVLKEIVKDGARAPAALLINQAHHLGRFNALVSGFLRNNHPSAQYSGVVHLAVHLLPLEIDVGRALHLLAPEAVEGREFGIFKAHQVGAVVNLEGGRHGFTHHHRRAAEGKAHEDIGLRAAGTAILPGR